MKLRLPISSGQLLHNPRLCDRIRFAKLDLLVRAMNGEQITWIGLERASRERSLAFMSRCVPA